MAADRRLRPVTVPGMSPCPQECAQVGEISAGPATPRISTFVEPARDRRQAADLRRRPDRQVPSTPGGQRRRRLSPVHRLRGTGGDGPGRRQGTRGGDRSSAVHSGRVVHVSTQGDGHRPTAGQQGCSGVDLHEQLRSPASTPVMTKMKYFSHGVLEPHSGWGAPGRAVPRGTWHGTMCDAGEDGRSRRGPRTHERAAQTSMRWAR